MSRELDRVFVEVCFDSDETDLDAVISEISDRFDGYSAPLRISPHRPPNVISDDYIRSRFAELLVVASRYANAFTERFEDELHVDPRLMMIAVRSAYRDIERYKLYHLDKPYSDLSDCVKRAAYITKWIAKVKPLQLSATLDKDDSVAIDVIASTPARASMANVMFAITCSLKYFECELGINPKLDQKVFHEAVYDLTFREINIDAKLMLFQLLVDRLGGNEIISKA